MRALVRLGSAGMVVCVGLGLMSACRSSEGPVEDDSPLGSIRLVAFDSCDDALTKLREASRQSVGPWGFIGNVVPADGAVSNSGSGQIGAPPPQNAAPDAVARGAESMAQPESAKRADPDDSYSGTNTHESGVDEPDLVKTDGRRIVTVSGSTLRVVDAVNRRVSGSLDLAASGANTFFGADDLLLSGDHALVLSRSGYYGSGVIDDRVRTDLSNGVAGRETKADPIIEPGPIGPRLMLVSLTGTPRILSSVAVDGSLLDARQVGSTARVVVRSSPRLPFPRAAQDKTDAERLAGNLAVIDQAPIDEWLPRIETTVGDKTTSATVDCSAISRPASFTGGNLITILTFDLSRSDLGDGQPTTLVADGETVYSNGPSLYVANNRWNGGKVIVTDATAPSTTDIYRFETKEGQRPTFAAGGSVPGNLLNQYSLSEYEGKLRVATTSAGAGTTESSSGIYVLEQSGRGLKQIGAVEGLGKTERIHAVRFLGPTGYVVTFRQTDPLYTVDLSDPARPAVRGELKIPGYSAYLHPVEGGKLIGIGQNATEQQGRTTGTQVSLFDVGNLASPARVAQFSMSGAHSEAEFDPHAFLFWPATGLLVVPLQTPRTIAKPNGPNPGRIAAPRFNTGALVLRVSGDKISEVGFLQHPEGTVPIRRSLVIGKTLWTVSDAGLMASDLTTLTQQAWIPLR